MCGVFLEYTAAEDEKLFHSRNRLSTPYELYHGDIQSPDSYDTPLIRSMLPGFLCRDLYDVEIDLDTITPADVDRVAQAIKARTRKEWKNGLMKMSALSKKYNMKLFCGTNHILGAHKGLAVLKNLRRKPRGKKENNKKEWSFDKSSQVRIWCFPKGGVT